MATTPARRRTPPASAPRTAPAPRARAVAPPADPLALARRRRQIEYISVDDIQVYEYNPRDNELAIPQVAESIKAFGFLVPCVVDDDNVLVAGHTRTEAAKLLGLLEVPCIRASDLNEAQIMAFRLVDNKVSEAAKWDHDLLAGEIQRIADLGVDYDMTAFGWSAEEIDCLSQVVGADCLDATAQLGEVAQEGIEAARAGQRRAPTQARFVLGEVTFFISATAYRNWVDGLRQLHDYNEAAIGADIKRRLGILE